MRHRSPYLLAMPIVFAAGCLSQQPAGPALLDGAPGPRTVFRCWSAGAWSSLPGRCRRARATWATTRESASWRRPWGSRPYASMDPPIRRSGGRGARTRAFCLPPRAQPRAWLRSKSNRYSRAWWKWCGENDVIRTSF